MRCLVPNRHFPVRSIFPSEQVAFREEYFAPTFSKWEGNISAGVQIYQNLSQSDTDPLSVGLTIIETAMQQSPGEFGIGRCSECFQRFL